MQTFIHFLKNISVWQIRIVALASLILSIGFSSQMMVNAFANNTINTLQAEYHSAPSSLDVQQREHCLIVLQHISTAQGRLLYLSSHTCTLNP